MKCGFLLDVVIAQRAVILKLLSGKNETLLVWWDTLLVLNFRFNMVDRVAGLNLECDGLTSEGFDEDLHGRYSGVLYMFKG